MAALPYMKLYPADYFGDTRHLSCLQHGAYLQLLMTYWRRGQPLPDDDAFLARSVGLGPREWKRHRDTLSHFFEVADGAWFHRRVDRELSDASDKSLKSQDAGRTSAQRRLNGRSTGVQRPRNPSESESLRSDKPERRKKRAGARKDDLAGGKKGAGSTAPPEPVTVVDGEEPVMSLVREELAKAIGAAPYDTFFAAEAHPVRFLHEEGRLIVVTRHTFWRVKLQDDFRQHLIRIATDLGFSDCWIEERADLALTARTESDDDA